MRGFWNGYQSILDILDNEQNDPAQSAPHGLMARSGSLNPSSQSLRASVPTDQPADFSTGSDTDPNQSGRDASLDPETQVALSSIERVFAHAKHIDKQAKDVLSRVTNGALSSSQIDNIYDQVAKNISYADALKFASIDPSADTLSLTPEQMDILNRQIDGLSPDAHDAARTQLDRAVANGTVLCPDCAQ